MNQFFKNGALNRDPRPASPVKTFKRGAKQTIKTVNNPKRGPISK